jgi:hypothetical protein|tara:strand:+ start:1073 stop:1306 length:234 start_codon:yes stop_codon:yes gene_type:complete
MTRRQYVNDDGVMYPKHRLYVRRYVDADTPHEPYERRQSDWADILYAILRLTLVVAMCAAFGSITIVAVLWLMGATQ